jgi:hypothetical protein
MPNGIQSSQPKLRLSYVLTSPNQVQMGDKTADQSALGQHLKTLDQLNLTDPQIHQSCVPGYLL